MDGTFYGWYFKCQSDTQTLAIIPALHGTGRKQTCSVQIMTENGVWTASFPGSEFHRIGQNISIGKNRFSKSGIRIDIREPKLRVQGKLSFGRLSPLKYDIMGPFALLPYLECRHSVWSMRHTVSGIVFINGQKHYFRNACGYWEGDRGQSFPKAYVWTQCFFKDGSLMLSVADVPVAGFHFNGVIGVVWWRGREYRLATYLGARVVRLQDGVIRVIQGDMELEARLLDKDKVKIGGRPLKAPQKGNMVRTIHENAACHAFYRFRKGKRMLFSFKTNGASFEYEYPM